MDKEGWITQLGRLYKEVSAAEGGNGADAHTDQFNRILSNLQEEFPHNQFVQNTQELKHGVYTQDRIDANQEIKMKCGQLADALGYTLPESDLEQDGDLTVISLQADQKQTAEQSVSQQLSIENVMEMVNYTTLNAQNKAELQDVVQGFEEELSKSDPDPSTLRDYINNAKEYSVDVAAKLSMLALSHGIVGVLGL